MDVADLLVQPPESETWANWLLCSGIVLFLAACGIVFPADNEDSTRKKVWRFSAVALVLTLSTASFIAGVAVERRYTPPKYDKVLETRLFEDYGFTAPDLSWRRIENSGSDGLITTMKRDGEKFTVKVTLEGSKLSLVGTDGQKIPVHNQSLGSSK